MSCSTQISDNRSDSLKANRYFQNLSAGNQAFLSYQTEHLHLSHQDQLALVEIATDFEMWEVGSLDQHWEINGTERMPPKQRKKTLINRLKKKREELKTSLPDYTQTDLIKNPKGRIKFSTKPNNDPVIGTCPVYSPKTRCCNLQTLDAVMNCGFECSYCSIQSFYHGEEIVFQGNFKEKLHRIEIDPTRTYHIGTGQASDSLLWGNKNNVLQDLFEWVEQYPNVVLELKTKSANIHYLLNHDVPSNVIATWSLNAETIAKNEELRTAPLDSRIAAARKVADQGVIVGFHLHPIVMFKGWETEYPAMIEKLLNTFSPEEVALVSMGTLTFIKPVMKQLRERKMQSKILQMPFEDAAGKSSYPIELKKDFFKKIYDCFGPWHGKVFFYLCMEDPALWPYVFGFDYENNDAFEADMKASYLKKIKENKKRLSQLNFV